MRLVLVRHGETSHNREGRVQGQSDLGLTPEGLRQARAIATSLERTQADALYASPLRRAMETAEPIAQELGLTIIPADGLKEAHVGRLDSLTLEEMRQGYPEFMERWRKDVATAVMPGGESLEQLQDRAWGAVQEMVAGHPQGTVIAVTHNFTISMILCRALELPIPFFHHLRHQVASLTTLEQDSRGWALVNLNDTCHLAPPPCPPRRLHRPS